MMRHLDYRVARERMQTGDVMAFAGRGRLSRLISWSTSSPVTHVGMIVITLVDVGGTGLHRVVQMVDSTSLDGRRGVGLGLVSQRLREYEGTVWWLPLGADVRAQLDVVAVLRWLRDHEMARYDRWQAVRAGIGDLVPVPQIVRRSYRRLYCSEMVAAPLQAGGALQGVHASRETPAELCRRRAYDADYYLLAGPTAMIPGYNTVAVAA